MENRKKVILHRPLTDDQINLLYWMEDRYLLDNDTWDIQVLDEAENREEV